MAGIEDLFGPELDQPAAQARPYTQSDVHIVAQSAQRIVDVINESLLIAKTSFNADTKLSRLRVAYENLQKVKRMVQEYPFLVLKSLDEVQAEMDDLAVEFIACGYQEIAAGNLRAQSLEKEGRTDEAVAEYEALLTAATDTPFTYRRLAIIYAKKKDIENELRVLRAALQNVPKQNEQHHTWFKERLEKRQAKYHTL